MDFERYTQKLATLTDKHLQSLLVYSMAMQRDSEPEISFFTKRINPGLNSSALKQRYHNADTSVKQLVDLLGTFFNFRQYLTCEVNTLQPGSSIVEHTDQSSEASVTGINEVFGTNVSVWHTVHVPLTGQADYWFRRDERLEPELQSMTPGGVYAFNNYVMHSVTNTGDVPRTNLILHLYDPFWLSKRALYGEFNMRGMY